MISYLPELIPYLAQVSTGADPSPLDPSEAVMIARVAGIGMGVVFGLIYIHYAWYTREANDSDLRKHVKVKAFVALTIHSGVSLAVARYFPGEFGKVVMMWGWMLMMVTSAIGLFGMVAAGAVLGYTAEPFKAAKLNRAIESANVALFQGWNPLREFLRQENTRIHEQSKIALSKLNIDAEGALEDAKKGKRRFVPLFESLVGFTLQSFFQHNRDEHRDYCACYYKFSEAAGYFIPIAALSGSDTYRVSRDRKLAAESLAFASYRDGRMIVFNKSAGVDGPQPNPPIRRKIERFICIPVPPGENLPKSSRVGVLCIDSAKAGGNFDDLYHRNILEWLGHKLAQLDECLVKEKEWKS